jgi:hypothetical protein
MSSVRRNTPAEVPGEPTKVRQQVMDLRGEPQATPVGRLFECRLQRTEEPSCARDAKDHAVKFSRTCCQVLTAIWLRSGPMLARISLSRATQ